METRRSHLVAAGALLLGTTVAGTLAHRGGAAPPPVPPAHTTTFAAPGGGPVTFTGTLDRSAVLLGRDGLVHMELAIAAPPHEAQRQARRPTDLAIVLDRSGSMDGDKIVQARAAVRELIGQLGPQDRFALVTYSDDAAVTIPLAAVDERARTGWLATVASLQPSGGTNMSSGLDRALDLIDAARAAGRVPHAILISDGLANQGDPSPEGLTRRAHRAGQGEYTLSTVGVGTDFNEYLMTALADAGTGNYYYVRQAGDLGGVFAREFDAARSTVAAGLAVRIDPASGVRVLDAAGYPLEAVGDAIVFHPGALFAGQERRIWVTLAVPQQTVGEFDLGRFSLDYGSGDARRTLAFAQTPRVACVRGEDEFYAGIDADAWSRSVTVEGYNQMQAEVARDVKEGRRDRALERLRAFKDETAAMNARVQSAPVAHYLDSADHLREEVDDAFRGPGQAGRQNELSKSTSAAAVDARRKGAKK